MIVKIIRPETVDPVRVEILRQAIIQTCIAAKVKPARTIREGHPEDEPEDFYEQVKRDNEEWHKRMKEKEEQERRDKE